MKESVRRRRSAITHLFVTIAVLMGVVGTPGPTSTAAAPGGKLTLGKTYTETYTGPDVYTGYDLKLPSSGRLTMTLELVSGEGADYDFSVLDSQGNALIVCNLHEGAKQIKESHDLLGGDYVLVISGKNTVGTVSFKLDFAPVKETCPETISDRHDTVEDAAKITLNKEITGQFAVNDDRDMYSLSIPKSGKLTLTLSTKDIASMEVSLLDRVGNRMWIRDEVSSGKNVWELALEKGEYILSLRNNETREHTGIYILKTNYDAKSPTLPKIQLKNVKNLPEKSVKITWKKVKNVSGYEVQISRKKSFSSSYETGKLEKSSASSIRFSGLDKKKTYYVRVRTYNAYISGKTAYSKWSKVGKVKIKK